MFNNKSKCSFTVMLAAAITIICLLIPMRVYAGGNEMKDCGNNLSCDYSYYEESDSATLYINLKKNLVPELNAMYDYGEVASPWYECGISEKVKEIDIAYGVYSIGENAFEGMKKLTVVYIPQTLSIVKSNAFKDCQNLKAVYFGGTEEEWKRLTGSVSETGNDFLLIF